MAIPEISVTEAHLRLTGPNPPRLIDVREPEEWELAHVDGAENIPLSEWPHVAQKHLTRAEEPLLILCHHGGRSAQVTDVLIRGGFTNVTNIAGGIDAWSVQVDPAVPRY